MCATWNKPLGLGPCYEACLLVDSASLESILSGPRCDDVHDHSEDSTAYVNVVDMTYDPGKRYEKPEYKGFVKVAAHQLALFFSNIQNQSLDQLFPGPDRIWRETANVSSKRLSKGGVILVEERQASTEEEMTLMSERIDYG